MIRCITRVVPFSLSTFPHINLSSNSCGSPSCRRTVLFLSIYFCLKVDAASALQPSSGFLQPAYQPSAPPPAQQAVGFAPPQPVYYSPVQAVPGQGPSMVTGTSPSWTTVILVWIATFFVGFLTNFALIHYFPEQTRSIRKALKSFGSSVSGHMPQGQPAAHVGQMVSNPVTVLTRKVQPRASIGSSKSDGEAERASKDAKVSRKKDDTSSDKLRVPKIKLSGSHSKNGHDREHTRSRSRKPTTEEGGESKKVKSERTSEHRHELIDSSARDQENNIPKCPVFRSHEKRHRVRSEDNTVHSSGKKKLHH